MMQTQPGWFRSTAVPPGPVDTVVFDVDGVLWDTRRSYDDAVLQTVDFVMSVCYERPLVRPVGEEDLRLFRRAGGLNNDWDLAYTLIALQLAGRVDFMAAAAESAGRGRAWAATLCPSHPGLEFELVRDVFSEIYWGRERYADHAGRSPRYVPDAAGTWHKESRLLPEGMLDRLQELGVIHFGIATGRSQTELATVLGGSDLAQRIPPQAIVTGDMLVKPDGRVLQQVLAGLRRHDLAGTGPRIALFCGDTRDDLQAVINYRNLMRPGRARPDLAHLQAPWIGAVAVVSEQEFQFFQENGADAAITHVAQLPQLIESFHP